MKTTMIFLLGFLSFYELTSAVAQSNDITIAEYGEFPLYAPLYLADAKGFFRDEGLNVKIVSAGGDEKVFAALLSGDAQFGVGDPIFVAIAGEKGKPGRIVTSLLQSVPQWALTKNKNIPNIEKPEQLNGLSIVTYPAPSTSYTLQKWLFQMGGLKPSIIQMAYGSLLPALEANRADIILEYEPVASMAEEKGARRLYTLSTFFPEFALTGVSVLPSYLETNPEVVSKVVFALIRGAKVLDTNLDEGVEIIAKRFPTFPLSALKTGIERANAVGSFPKDGMVTEKAWNAAVKLRIEVGDLKQAAPFSTYVVNSFAEAASNKVRTINAAAN
jgi:NitT/TauT family transport system substrate-binding protein